ncbi:unnamed protein product [Cuscuta epithymum]|uniref:CCHC-type domain-containing protein n=1 Tax=Cuscuta epithymum TaxID=186058 RepID=A0AAV0EFM7_9ASTE|nr:unnamed protein product [Cuscuta epithymum]
MRLKKLREASTATLFSANVAHTETSSQSSNSETSALTESSSANMAQFNNPNQSNSYRGRGRGGSNRGRGGRFGGRNSVFCQVCGKPGHHALICYHRYNPNFTTPNQNPTYTPSSSVTSNQSPYYQFQPHFNYPSPYTPRQNTPQPYTSSSHPGQFFNPQPTTPENANWDQHSVRPLPSAALASTSSILGPAPSPQQWFPDSGATHHITADPLNFQHSEPLASTDKLFMGNGQGF